MLFGSTRGFFVAIMNRQLQVRGAAVLLLFCGALGSVPVVHSQSLDAHLYTDQQLLDAGWTDTQIAAMRAVAPEVEPEPPRELAKEAEMKEESGMQETGMAKELQPTVAYSSVFDNYTSFEDTPQISWREANDLVGKIGGWRAYARQVQEEQKRERMAEEADDQ